MHMAVLLFDEKSTFQTTGDTGGSLLSKGPVSVRPHLNTMPVEIDARLATGVDIVLFEMLQYF